MSTYFLVRLYLHDSKEEAYLGKIYANVNALSLILIAAIPLALDGSPLQYKNTLLTT